MAGDTPKTWLFMVTDCEASIEVTPLGAPLNMREVDRAAVKFNGLNSWNGG